VNLHYSNVTLIKYVYSTKVERCPQLHVLSFGKNNLLMDKCGSTSIIPPHHEEIYVYFGKLVIFVLVFLIRNVSDVLDYANTDNICP
jgi:hypothetical protein